MKKNFSYFDFLKREIPSILQILTFFFVFNYTFVEDYKIYLVLSVLTAALLAVYLQNKMKDYQIKWNRKNMIEWMITPLLISTLFIGSVIIANRKFF